MVKTSNRHKKLSNSFIKRITFIVLSALTFLVVIPLLIIRNDKYVYGINHTFTKDVRYRILKNERKTSKWEGTTIRYRRGITSSLRPYKIDDDMCINRTNYMFEYLRLLGINPHKKDYEISQPLIIGNDTSIGAALESLIPLSFAIKSQSAIDFIAPKCPNFIDFLNISQAYIISSFDIPKNSTPNVFKYSQKRYHSHLKTLLSQLKIKNIPTVFVGSKSTDAKAIELAKEAGCSIVISPVVLDRYSIYGKLVYECMQYGKSTVTVYDHQKPTRASAKKIAKFLLSEKVKYNHKILEISSITEFKPNEILKICSHKIHRCQIENQEKLLSVITDPPKSHEIIELEPKSSAIAKKVRKLQLLPRKDDSIPYITFISVLTNQTLESNVHRFLKSIKKGTDFSPLANIRVIIVDAQRTFKGRIKIPKAIKDIVDFTRVVIPNKYKKNESFTNIALDAALRTVKSPFVAMVSPDAILGNRIFEIISEESLSGGTIYRANGYSANFRIFTEHSFEEIMNSIGEYDDARILGLQTIRHPMGARTTFFSKAKEIAMLSEGCNEFMIAATDFVRYSGGFRDQCDLFYGRTLNQVMGSVEVNLPAGYIIQEGNEEKKSNTEHLSSQILEDYECTGEGHYGTYYEPKSRIRLITDSLGFM